MREHGRQLVNDLLACREAIKAKRVLIVVPNKKSKIATIRRIKDITSDTWPIGLKVLEVTELASARSNSEIRGISSNIIIDDPI